MTSLVPRPPYTQDELARLYPNTLKLQLVQVVCEVFPSQPLPIRVGTCLDHADVDITISQLLRHGNPTNYLSKVIYI